MPDFPRVATDVWAYATRTLTGFTGTPRSDLVGLDEAVYTRLDVAVSTRSSHAAADIWAVTTRTLTGITGTPRTDLLGEDADFESGTAARKARIDRLMAAEPETEGSLTMDGTEQTLILSELGVQHHIEGMVDLTPMAAGDTVVIRQYMSIVTPVSYVKYAEETYSDAQTIPLLYITTKTATYGLRVTIQQTAGVYKTFNYQFFTRREA